MNIYIFENLSQVSHNYHPDGGIVIIAHSIESGKQLVSGQYSNIVISDEEWERAETYEVSATEEKYIVFPNAGCC